MPSDGTGSKTTSTNKTEKNLVPLNDKARTTGGLDAAIEGLLKPAAH